MDKTPAPPPTLAQPPDYADLAARCGRAVAWLERVHRGLLDAGFGPDDGPPFHAAWAANATAGLQEQLERRATYPETRPGGDGAA